MTTALDAAASSAACRSSELQPGDKLPSESEICGLFSVSRSSVRQALARLSRDGWVETMRGIGTFVRARSGDRTMDVGFVCYYMDTYIFPRIVQSATQVLFKSGFHLMVNESRYDLQAEREILGKLLQKPVDGIIIEPYFDARGPANRDLLAEIQARGIPVVLIDNYYPDGRFNVVAMDDRKGGELAASYLWEKGHRRIGVIYKSSYYPFQQRKEGALAFLRARGAEVDERWIIGFEGSDESAAYRAAAQAFDTLGDPPSAIICTNDQEAVLVMQAAEERSLPVPDSLSVISFDNSDLSRLDRISLTSIDHPNEYMGRLAASLLLQQMLSRDVVSRTVSLVEPRIVERESVADLRRAVSTVSAT